MKALQGVNGKILVVGLLVLIMLIPIGMVESLIDERQTYRAEALEDVTSKWGEAQTITGPVVTIPYRTSSWSKRSGDTEEVIQYHQILPDQLVIKGKLTSQVRQRGIYEVALFNVELDISGTLAADIDGLLEVASETDILWEQATISLGISDMVGIQQRIQLTLGDRELEMDPGLTNVVPFGAGVSERVPDFYNLEGKPFHIQLNVNGSDGLRFVPLAIDNQVSLVADWADPSFAGAFLPTQHEISKSGFEASWSVLNLNRNYPQHWINGKHKVEDSAFGVDLYLSADVYQQSIRSVKYALLFIISAFGTFFSFEMMRGNRVHPFQYALIGIAVSVFYLLLISLSEHLGFDVAYLLASVAVTSMIGLYAVGVFNETRPGLIISGVLALLYGYLYALLQLRDYALLAGSLGLFVGVGALMYLSRKVDWYGADAGENRE